MEEIKIPEALEEEAAKEAPTASPMEEAPEDQPEEVKTKTILILVGVVLGIFLLSFAGLKTYQHFTGATVVNIDDLHRENLENRLDQKEGYLYKGYSFVYVDGLWWTEIQQGKVLLKVPLHFGPKDLENITIEGQLDHIRFNRGENISIAINPEFANKYYTLSLSELNFNVVNGMKKRPVAACTQNNSICQDREILNCENTEGKPVIELRYGGEPKITLKGTCILITGQEYGLVKATDRLIWQWYGVMS